ncbi:MAG: hypothetical protein WBA87_09260 [Microbacterium sp.]
MNRFLAGLAALLLSTTALVACASDAPAPSSGDAPASTAPQESESPDSADDAPVADAVIPQGARPASAEFPFPVPEDWPELMPFAEEKIGKAVGMSASFGHPGEAAADAQAYRQLLEQAGFTIDSNPLGEQVHAASFIAKGAISGSAYSGTLDFDTDADGTPRVMINLTED